MKHRFRVATLALLGAAACTTEELSLGPQSAGPLDVLIVSPDEVSSMDAQANLTVDLRDRSRVYVFDQSQHPIDFSRIRLICPTGSAMPMNDWLFMIINKTGFDITAADDHRFMLATQPLHEEECKVTCYQCSDGAWICRDDCPPGLEMPRVHPIDNTGVIQDPPPPPNNPDEGGSGPTPSNPGDPVDEGSGAGGGWGGGGSGGGGSGGGSSGGGSSGGGSSGSGSSGGGSSGGSSGGGYGGGGGTPSGGTVGGGGSGW